MPASSLPIATMTSLFPPLTPADTAPTIAVRIPSLSAVVSIAGSETITKIAIAFVVLVGITVTLAAITTVLFAGLLLLRLYRMHAGHRPFHFTQPRLPTPPPSQQPRGRKQAPLLNREGTPSRNTHSRGHGLGGSTNSSVAQIRLLAHTYTPTTAGLFFFFLANSLRLFQYPLFCIYILGSFPPAR